jgi:hypothetical protein
MSPLADPDSPYYGNGNTYVAVALSVSYALEQMLATDYRKGSSLPGAAHVFQGNLAETVT